MPSSSLASRIITIKLFVRIRLCILFLCFLFCALSALSRFLECCGYVYVSWPLNPNSNASDNLLTRVFLPLPNLSWRHCLCLCLCALPPALARTSTVHCQFAMFVLLIQYSVQVCRLLKYSITPSKFSVQILRISKSLLVKVVTVLNI